MRFLSFFSFLFLSPLPSPPKQDKCAFFPTLTKGVPWESRHGHRCWYLWGVLMTVGLSAGNPLLKPSGLRAFRGKRPTTSATKNKKRKS